MMGDKELKPFNEAELVVGTLGCLLVDGASALLDLVPAFGLLAAAAIQSGASFGTTFWLMTKGGSRAARLERQVLKQGVNILPILPTVTTAFIIETVVHNRKVKHSAA